jgi:hypothetical protein
MISAVDACVVQCRGGGWWYMMMQGVNKNSDSEVYRDLQFCANRRFLFGRECGCRYVVILCAAKNVNWLDKKSVYTAHLDN